MLSNCGSNLGVYCISGHSLTYGDRSWVKPSDEYGQINFADEITLQKPCSTRRAVIGVCCKTLRSALPLQPQLAHSNPQAYLHRIVMLQNLDKIIHFHINSCVQQKNISMLFLFHLAGCKLSVNV